MLPYDLTYCADANLSFISSNMCDLMSIALTVALCKCRVRLYEAKNWKRVISSVD